MMTFYQYNKWLPIEKVLDLWSVILPYCKNIKLVLPEQTGGYKEIYRIDCPPKIRDLDPHRCKMVHFRGLMNYENPFLNMGSILDKALIYQFIGPDINFHYSIGYQEKNTSQPFRFRNELEIWYYGAKIVLMISFGGGTKVYTPENLENFRNQVNLNTCFKLGNLTISYIGHIRYEVEGKMPVDDLVKGVQTILEMVGYNFIDYVYWGMSCIQDAVSEKFGFESYNRTIDLELPADVYDVELVVGQYKSFKELESLRPLCGPEDRSVQCLGQMKLPRGNKLSFYILTSAQGHQLALSLKKPYDQLELPIELLNTLLSSGFDFSRPLTEAEFFNKKNKDAFIASRSSILSGDPNQSIPNAS